MVRAAPPPRSFHACRLAPRDRRLEPWPPAPLTDAIWIDLHTLDEAEAARVEAELGIEVPTLADMEEIEISNRLFREDAHDVMTVLLPGHRPDGSQLSGPVTFIVAPERLLSVRHHAPRPFETFPLRADRSSTRCETAGRLFIGLVEEIVARLADHIEGAGRELDRVAARAVPQSLRLVMSLFKKVGMGGVPDAPYRVRRRAQFG